MQGVHGTPEQFWLPWAPLVQGEKHNQTPIHRAVYRLIERGSSRPMQTTEKRSESLILKLKQLPENVASAKIRYGWLIILAFLLQWMIFIVFSDSSPIIIKKAGLILSYVILLGALSRNLHLWGFRIAALGAAFNFIAILTNGGLMPVSNDAALRADPAFHIANYGTGVFLPRSTAALLPANQTHLAFLSDIISVSWLHSVISVGDVIILIGLLVFILGAVKSCQDKK
jgi:hypothetical protein